MLFKKNQPVVLNDVTLEKRVELTLIDPRAVEKDIHTLINIALKNGYYGVCVNPCNVYIAKDYIENVIKYPIKVISVIGFPLGANTMQTKIHEAKEALRDGADELDVVINISCLKEGNLSYVKTELSKIRKIAKGKIVKAIIETCYLSYDDLKAICKICVKAKFDFIKTSTGYGTGGATVDDVRQIKEIVGDKCQIKASGGIRTREQANELVRAGASRIGTSKVI